MSSADLTEEQQRARDTRDVSVALAAGAGCGKTHVLTARFLSHLDPALADGESVALRQLIAITFTDAAAREMRSRIRTACYERLDDGNLSDDQRAAWLGLLREIDGARVSTIHAFCAALLRSHATEAGLDPLFGVLEPGEADVLLQEVLDDLLRRRLAEHDPTTLDLAAECGNLAQLKQRIALFVDKRHLAAFRRWLVGEEDLESTAGHLVDCWKRCHDQESTHIAVQAFAETAPLDEMHRLLAVASPVAANKKFPAAIATLSDLLARLQSSPESITRDDLAAIVANARVQTICKKDDWPTTEDYESYGDSCKKLRDIVRNCWPVDWKPEAALMAAVSGLKLLRLAGNVSEEYQARKQQIAKLDFDDLLTLAHRLLTDPQNAGLRDALSADLRLLLVDEFQDTDPLQVELIKRICGAGFDEGRLFFVGDFKQSIYRFRGAVPPEFLKLRSEIHEDGQLQLSRNFRSQPGMLHFVNALFHDSFGDEARLKPVRKAVAESANVEFLWTIPVGEEAGSKVSSEKSRQQEATAIARRLRQLIDGTTGEIPVIDRATKQPRQLRPGDVAILFRTLSDVRLYEAALREQGLEYYLVGGHAFYAQQEIFDVLNLLRSIASSADEISLAGVLRSPFFGLADEALFWLVEHGGSLNAGLCEHSPPAELSGDEQAKVVAAARTLGQLRACKDALPIATLLNTALDLTGYDAVLATEFLGERKLANLQKLIEQARVADANDGDLNDFIVQLTEFISQPPKEPLASTSAESANVIRLMTIHRAKGLEFPFVVLPDLDRHGQPIRPAAALDEELGPLVRLANDEDGESYATGMTLYTARERGEEREERKRLLYVATTRAADYLLLSSSIEAFDHFKSDWMQLIAAHFDLASGEFLGELPPGYERPRVHIAPLPENPPKSVGESRGADLVRMLEEAHALAAEGGGIIPPHVGPIPIDRAARRRFSFSQLAEFQRRADDEASGDKLDVTPARSSISAALRSRGGGSPNDAVAFGLLVHDVLTRLDFAGAELAAEIANWCEHLASEYVQHDIDQAARRAAAMISRFTATPRGQQPAAAESVHREIECLLSWPIPPFPLGKGPGEGALAHTEQGEPAGHFIRGFIDCLYQDAAGNWRIVDFKTNEVPKSDAEHLDQLADRYRMQLYVYALAAEQALGESPSELVLELLQPGIEIAIRWTDDERRRAVDMIGRAIAAEIEAESAGAGDSRLGPPPRT